MTAKTLASYRSDGVVRVALLDPDEAAELRRNLERYEQRIAPTVADGDIVRESAGGAIRNLWRMERYDDWFAALGRHPQIVSLVAALVDGEPELLAVETFNKAARQGSAVPPHQDNAYFCRVPADVLTIWIAVDAATAANGPVQYLPGTKHELLPHVGSGIPGNSMLLADPPSTEGRTDVVSGILSPGDAMIHHCQTIHWSVPNTSDRPRRGLLLVYRGRQAEVSADLRAAYDRAQAAFKNS